MKGNMKKALLYLTLLCAVFILLVVGIIPSLGFFAIAYFIYKNHRPAVLGISLFFIIMNLFISSFEDVIVWAIVFFVYLANKKN